MDSPKRLFKDSTFWQLKGFRKVKFHVAWLPGCYPWNGGSASSFLAEYFSGNWKFLITPDFGWPVTLGLTRAPRSGSENNCWLSWNIDWSQEQKMSDRSLYTICTIQHCHRDWAWSAWSGQTIVFHRKTINKIVFRPLGYIYIYYDILCIKGIYGCSVSLMVKTLCHAYYKH